MGHAVQVCREAEYKDALQVLSNFTLSQYVLK